MNRGSAFAVLGLGALVLGAVAWGVLGGKADPEPVDDYEHTEVFADVAPTPPPVREPANVEPRRASNEPVVPRVLPPDAALEDVRDALFANDPDLLVEASTSIGRLASQSAQSLVALQRQIDRTDDARIRGVAIVATSRSRSDAALRYASKQLIQTKRREAPDIVGSFAALLLAPNAKTKPVALSQLSDLPVIVGDVDARDHVERAIVFFLDHTSEAGDEAADLVDLWVRALEAGPRLATLLVDAGRRRPYVTSLADADWQRIRTAALRHDLDEDVKRAYVE